MTSTNTKLLLASTALVSAVATSEAMAYDASAAVTAVDGAQLVYTDVDSSTTVNSGDTIALSAAGTSLTAVFADATSTTSKIDLNVAGVVMTVDTSVTTGNGAANGADAIVVSAAGTLNVNSGVTVSTTASDSGAAVLVSGDGATVNVSGILSSAAGDGIETSGDIATTLNVLSGGSAGSINAASAATASTTISVAGTAGAITYGNGGGSLTLTSGTTGAVTGGTGIENVTASGTNTVASFNGTSGADVFTVTGGTTTVTTTLDAATVNVTGGTLAVGGNFGASDVDDVTVSSGATLDVTGTTGVDNNLTVAGTADFTDAVTVGNLLNISGTVTSAAGVAASSHTTVSGSYTEGGNFSTAGNLTVSGTYDVTGTTGVTGNMTVSSGATADLTGAATIGGNLTVGGTLNNAAAGTIAGTATFQNGSVSTLAGSLTGITTLSVADGAKLTVQNGATLEADTGAASSLKNITLELTAANNAGGIVAFSAEDVSMTSAEHVKVTAAQGVDLSAGYTYAGLVQGQTAAVSPTEGISHGNALYTYTWTANGADYDLAVALKNAGVTTLAGAATGSNNKGVATVVDSAALATLYSDVMAQSDTDAALESLNPDVSGGAGAASINTTVASTGTVSNRLALLRGTDNGRSGMVAGEEMMANREMWLQAFGTSVEQDERKGVKGFDATTSGLAIGVDTDELVHGARVGVAFSYAQADVDSDQSNNAQTDIDTYQLTAYGSKDLANDMYVDAMVSYAWNSHEGSRVDFLGDTYTSDYDGNQFSVKGEVGKSYDWANTRVTPNVSLHYINVETDSYREAGAAGNGLSVNTDDQEAFLLSIGSDIEWNITGRDGSEYMPYLRAKYSYDMMGDEVETTSTFLAGGSAFTSEGADIARSSLGLGAGVNVVTTSGFEFTAGYDAEIKEDFLAHTGMLQARWSF